MDLLRPLIVSVQYLSQVEIEFQPPRGLSVIPKVDGKDIMEALRRLIFDPARDRREKKIQPREIIETLAKVKGVNDPLLLCARATRHVGHYIRLINDMRKRADAMRKEAEKEAEMEAEREAEFAKQKAMASQKESLKQGLGSLSMLEHVLEPLQDRVLKEAPNVAEGWLLSDLAKFVPPDGEAGGLRDRVDVLLWHAAKHLPEGMTPTSLLSQDQVEVFSAALLDPPGDFLDVVFECLVEGTKQDKESLLDSHFSVIDFLNTDCFG